MNQIAQAAQVGPGTLYRHFANKGDLCEVLLADDIAAFQGRVAAIMERPEALTSALACLERIIDETLRMFELHVQFLSAIQEGGGMRHHTASHEPVHIWLHDQIATLLSAAVAQGEATNLDVEFTADMLMAVLAPPLYVFLEQQRGFSRGRVAAGVRRLFIDGLRQPTSSPQ